MKITKEQFEDITFALTLAKYFVEEQEPSNPCHSVDTDTLERANRAVAEVKRGDSMKTYQVQVHYQATGYFSIIAESEEDASQQAIRKAYSEHPDDLFAEVVNVEEETA